MTNATLLFLSGPDLLVVVLLAILLFGGKRIPEFAKGLGQSIRHFKEGSEGKDDKSDPPKGDQK
jgi:sec-independent protein translocase protein TatA